MNNSTKYKPIDNEDKSKTLELSNNKLDEPKYDSNAGRFVIGFFIVLVILLIMFIAFLAADGMYIFVENKTILKGGDMERKTASYIALMLLVIFGCVVVFGIIVGVWKLGSVLLSKKSQ